MKRGTKTFSRYYLHLEINLVMSHSFVMVIHFAFCSNKESLCLLMKIFAKFHIWKRERINISWNNDLMFNGIHDTIKHNFLEIDEIPFIPSIRVFLELSRSPIAEILFCKKSKRKINCLSRFLSVIASIN